MIQEPQTDPPGATFNDCGPRPGVVGQPLGGSGSEDSPDAWLRRIKTFVPRDTSLSMCNDQANRRLSRLTRESPTPSGIAVSESMIYIASDVDQSLVYGYRLPN